MASIAAQAERPSTRFESISSKLSELTKGLDEAENRAKERANRLGGTEPETAGVKAGPVQPVANGLASEIDDQVGYALRTLGRLHEELSRLDRL